MGRLVKAEFLKLSKSLGFKILILCGIAVGLLIGVIFAFMPMPTDIPEELVAATAAITQLTGIDAFLMEIASVGNVGIFAGVFVALFIGSEFSHRTFGLSIMAGCSRISLFLAKFIVFFVGLLVVMLVYPIALAIFMGIVNGFGEFNAEVWTHLARTMGLLLLGYTALAGFCAMIATLIKNVGGTIGASLGILVILGSIVAIPNLSSVMRFTFVYQIAQVAQPSSMLMYIAVCAGTFLITMAVSVLTFKKTELK